MIKEDDLFSGLLSHLKNKNYDVYGRIYISYADISAQTNKLRIPALKKVLFTHLYYFCLMGQTIEMTETIRSYLTRAIGDDRQEFKLLQEFLKNVKVQHGERETTGEEWEQEASLKQLIDLVIDYFIELHAACDQNLWEQID